MKRESEERSAPLSFSLADLGRSKLDAAARAESLLRRTALRKSLARYLLDAMTLFPKCCSKGTRVAGSVS